MALIARVKLRYSGLNGAPGFSVFHFRDFVGAEPTLPDAQAAVDKVDTFAFNIKGIFLNTITLQTLPDVDVLDEATGQLENTLNATPDPAVTGGSTATSMSGASGAVITWRTGLVRNGRRLRGRTFLVPLSSGVYETNGTLTAGTIATINTAATALRDPAGGADLGVWGRPSGPGATDGVWGVANGHAVPDMAAVLHEPCLSRVPLARVQISSCTSKKAGKDPREGRGSLPAPRFARVGR
jgi:hypothetical protein